METEHGKSNKAVVSGDPLNGLPIGSEIHILYVKAPPIEVHDNLPTTVENWDFFEGSLLAIGFKGEGNVLDVVGTAVLLAPGVAISAKHIFADHLGAIMNGEVVLYGAGLRAGGEADLWQVQHVVYSDDGGDLAILAMQLVTGLPDDNEFACFSLSARRPRVGERLTLVGFQFRQDDDLLDGMSVDIAVRGHMFTAVGEVSQVFWPVRDAVTASFPAIEILCGVHGGMSGGAVFDRDGDVVGVISRGFLDSEPPSLAAWCVGIFGWHLTSSWPPKAYPPDTPIAAIPAIRIAGSEHFTVTDDGTVQFSPQID